MAILNECWPRFLLNIKQLFVKEYFLSISPVYPPLPPPNCFCHLPILNHHHHHKTNNFVCSHHIRNVLSHFSAGISMFLCECSNCCSKMQCTRIKWEGTPYSSTLTEPLNMVREKNIKIKTNVLQAMLVHWIFCGISISHLEIAYLFRNNTMYDVNVCAIANYCCCP